MTVAVPTTEQAPTAAPTSASPSGRTLWRQARAPLAVLAVLVVALVVLGVLRSTERGTLDPRSFSPGGGRAVAALLEQQGVRVTVVEDLAALDDQVGPGTTVFVPQTTVLFSGELAEIGRSVDRADGALLVGGADDTDLQDLDLPAAAVDATEVRTREPACGLPAAVAAGRARAGAIAYDGDGTACYGGSVLSLPDQDVTLVGSVSPFTNDRLAQEGNARLAVGLLSERDGQAQTDEVLWLVPRSDRPVPADATRELSDLVPRGLVWGVVQLGVAIALLALWRGRRLGRVVTEPLPVVVRGAEAVEGRARLYRAAGAHDQAAEALRAGARDRLLRALGLPSDSDRAGLVETLAARTGRDPYEADGLLYGPAPTDDAALVRLADELDRLQP